MFSPRPTLFFTLLSNLWDRNTRGWCTNWSTSLPCTSSLNLHNYTHYLALKKQTKTNIKRTKTIDKTKEMGGRQTERILAFSSPDRLGGLGGQQRGGKKNSVWNQKKNQTKNKKEERDKMGHKDIIEQKESGKHWISHLVLQADFGPDDVGSTRHQAERQMFWGTGCWKSTFILSRAGFN